MRIKSATVYQPAAPLRAVYVWLKDDGTHGTEDFEVIGAQMEHRVYDEGTDEECHEIHHDVLVWSGCDGIQTVAEFESDTTNRLIVAPATWPADYWKREIAREVKRLRSLPTTADA